MELKLGAMTEDDCEAVARLAGQLGYPSQPEQVRGRFRAVSESSDEQVVVARLDGRVAGWIQFRQHLSLASDPRLEILGLVVDELSRGQGIGSRLIEFAEAWGRARGLALCSFTSRVTRTEAHRLYQRLGYEIYKTSYYFKKSLG